MHIIEQFNGGLYDSIIISEETFESGPVKGNNKQNQSKK